MDDLTLPLPFFLYGTLMRGERGHTALALSCKAHYLGRARLPGTLFDLGDYPGFRSGRFGLVTGELFLPGTPGLVSALDAYELFDPAYPARSEYIRQQVILADRPSPCWTYVYNRPVKGRRVIASGNWRMKGSPP